MNFNNIILAREIQNYIDNYLNLTVDERKQIQQEIITNDDLNIINAKQSVIIQKILNNKYTDFIEYLQDKYKVNNIIFNDKKKNNLLTKIFEYCTYDIAQAEIQRNKNFNVGDIANNLSFSSQNPKYRKQPIIIYREFLNDSYKDHILYGLEREHHNDIIKKYYNELQTCKINGIDFYTCAYLYNDNIVYLSTNEQNPYGSLQAVANIIKQQEPQMSIYGVIYNDNNKQTKRLTEKI